MSVANYTETQETGITFTQAGGAPSGLGGVTVGTWGVENNSGHSGGHSQFSNNLGDFATLQFTGRALYLCGSTHLTGGLFTVSIDGVPQAGVFDELNGAMFSGNAQNYRVLQPLARNLVDGPHTVVLTQASGGTAVWVDSLIAITGPRGTPVPGNYVAIGDSWTTGIVGLNSTRKTYAMQLARMLQHRLERPLTVMRKGVAGERMVGGDASAQNDSIRAGALYRTLLDAVPNQPEFLTYLYGVNDFDPSNGGTAEDWLRHLFALLCLIEDLFDTTQTKVAISTPGYGAPWMQFNSAGVSQNSGGSISGADATEAAAMATHYLAGAFPWVKLANVYEVMDQRTEFLSSDYFHPNEAGHAVIANEYFRAFNQVVS